MSRKKMPPPDTSGTSVDSALNKRFSLGDSKQVDTPIPDIHMPIPEYGSGMGPTASKKRGRRADPSGMRRVSYYLSADAADALEKGVDQVREALGGEIARHVALSALIETGAAQTDRIIKELAQARAQALAAQLAELHEASR